MHLGMLLFVQCVYLKDEQLTNYIGIIHIFIFSTKLSFVMNVSYKAQSINSLAVS